MKKPLLCLIASTSPIVLAVSPEDTILAPFLSIIAIVASFGSLMNVVFIVVGMYSMYQLVSVFSDRDERDKEKRKRIPFYFLGAALGLGALASSRIVQNTVYSFDEGGRTREAFAVDEAFELN